MSSERCNLLSNSPFDHSFHSQLSCHSKLDLESIRLPTLPMLPFPKLITLNLRLKTLLRTIYA